MLPGHIGLKIAMWVSDIVSRKYLGELVDLKDGILPMENEPNLPAEGGYIRAFITYWKTCLYIFPKYNWG